MSNNKVTNLMERMPGFHGKALCLDCGYEFEGHRNFDHAFIQCPKCRLFRGKHIYPIVTDTPHFTCNCGNDIFHITPTFFYCPACGKDWSVSTHLGDL